MRRQTHTPVLYPHTEQNDEDQELDIDWTPQYSSSPPSAIRPKAQNQSRRHTTGGVGRSDYYSQFLKRYRSSEPGETDDPRNDPDSHYFQRGLNQLPDVGDKDSDDENDPSRASLLPDSLEILLENDAGSEHDKERLVWRAYLVSVLNGDILRSERARIATALESSGEERHAVRTAIWLEIRAKFHDSSKEEEETRLNERRVHVVDPVISDINAFRASSPDPTITLGEIDTLLNNLDIAQSLYPSMRAFYLDKPKATEPKFQARRDALNTWATVFTSLRRHISVLQRWTGSDTLDVTQSNTSPEEPTIADMKDGTSFVERVLKEESMQRMFEKSALVTLHMSIGAARDAQVNLATYFQEMNLPTFESQLVPLISFPTRFVQASLRVRLDYVQKLRDPELLIIDQMIEDLKLGIGLACTLKRQYEGFLLPDPSGKWNVPQCISHDFDQTILEAIKLFFRLIHWKLKGGAKGGYFKETDVLDSQWATLNDVSMTIQGGSSLIAEQLCSLTNRLMVRVINYFDTQVRVPTGEDTNEHRHHRRSIKTSDATNPASLDLDGPTSTLRTEGQQAQEAQIPHGLRRMTDSQKASWYGKILESVRLRYRKLQRFARVITQRFSNSAEYGIENVNLEIFIDYLTSSDHFLVYTHVYEEDGVYIVASPSLFERHEAIHRLLTEAFHVDEVAADGIYTAANIDMVDPEGELDEPQYLLILSPRTQFTWRGRIMMLELPKLEFETKDNRVRLVADGPQQRLILAKHAFFSMFDAFVPLDQDGLTIEMGDVVCITEQQAHFPIVNRELRKISRATMRLAESIVDSVHHVHSSMSMNRDCQELMAGWYLFASEHGQHAQKYMDPTSLARFNRLLIKLAISWVTFICDDCDPTDRRTFKWAVNSLEYTFQRINRNILNLPDEQFQMLRHKVAICINLLTGHFDILGARTNIEAKREKERLEAQLRRTVTGTEDDSLTLSDLANDPSSRKFWERISKGIEDIEAVRVAIDIEDRMAGRVLDNEKLEDRSLVFLTSTSHRVSLRWQQGKFIGAGAFGSVYIAVNLEDGSLMAVKEIKFQDLSGSAPLYSQIQDELSVMQMLHHENIVEYYGIEVHRDKVYIFEEYCKGGSLASVLEHGRIEDEGIIQVYTMQMLEGLSYLHDNNIIHRDIKPDNILLDHLGVIKFVDFGAAKILAKNQRTIQRSRRGPEAGGAIAGMGMNSLTGTPMYMSPEVIKNEKISRHGAMDIWSLGCVVLELATGKKPWSNLDNEWAIMFHIGVATHHPPLPEPGQLSSLGIDFIRRCLTIDPMKRPTAQELLQHPWIVEFREVLLSYQAEEEAGSPHPADETFEAVSVGRQAAKLHDAEVESMRSDSPLGLPPEPPLTPLGDDVYDDDLLTPIP